MAAITASGLASGLDASSIVSQLMTIERQPINLLTSQKSDINTKISALGSLKSALSSLQTAAQKLAKPATFAQHTASVADADVASVTAGTSAAAGSFKLEVTSLAKAQKLLSGSYASTTTAVGTGTLTLELGSVSAGTFTANPDKPARSITVDASNNTLTGLRDAINNAGAGVTASIVNDAPGSYRLLVSSSEGGTANQIRLSGIAGLDYDPATATGSFTQQVPASDAKFYIDDIEFTRSSNTVTDAITGLSLTLKGTNTGASTEMKVAQDESATTTAIKEFVSAYNSAKSNIKTATAYDATTKKGSTLNGDSAARAASTGMANALTHVPSGLTGSFQTLGQLGISLSSDGTLSFNESKFTDATAENRTDAINTLMAYAGAVNGTMDSLVGTDGAISTRTTSLNTSIKSIDKRIDAMNLRMTSIESRYRAQFTALETLMSKMNNTSSYLTSQLARL